jgi:hypothetical protein
MKAGKVPSSDLISPDRKVTENKTIIRLCHGDTSQVWVETEDEDRFLTTVEAAAHACKVYGKMAEVGKQLRTLLRKLADWIKNHDDVREAYLTPRDSGMLFLIVRKSKKFDSAFEDALSDLDVEIANDEAFALIRLSVLALPDTSEESIRSFLPAFRSEVPDAQ